MIIVEDKEQYYWCEWMGGGGGVQRSSDYIIGTKNITYPPSLFQFCQHDNDWRHLLPYHAPEVIKCLHQRTYKKAFEKMYENLLHCES